MAELIEAGADIELREKKGGVCRFPLNGAFEVQDSSRLPCGVYYYGT